MFEIDWNGSSNQELDLSTDPDDTYIVVNAVGCKKCKTTAVSQHRHDYVSCECGAVSADGGHDYIRRVGNLENMIELNIISSPEVSKRIQVICDNSHVIKEYRMKQQAEMFAALDDFKEKNKNNM